MAKKRQPKDDSSSDISDLDERISTLESNLEALKSDMADLVDVQYDLKAQLAKAEEKLKGIHSTMEEIASSTNAFAQKAGEIKEALDNTQQQLSSSNALLQGEVAAEQDRHSAHLRDLERLSKAQGHIRDTLKSGFEGAETYLGILADREGTLREQVTESFKQVGAIMEEFSDRMSEHLSGLVQQIGSLEAGVQEQHEKNTKVLREILDNREAIIQQFTAFNIDLQSISSSMEIVAEGQQYTREEENLRDGARMNDLGLQLIGTGQAESAVPILKGATELYPGHPEIMLNLGQAYLLLGRLDDAEKTFQRITERFPEFGQAFLGLAVVHIHQGRYAKAMETLNATEKLLPNRAEVKTYKGVAHFFLGATQDARTCWNRAVEIDPSLAERFEAAGLTL